MVVLRRAPWPAPWCQNRCDQDSTPHRKHRHRRRRRRPLHSNSRVRCWLRSLARGSISLRTTMSRTSGGKSLKPSNFNLRILDGFKIQAFSSSPHVRLAELASPPGPDWAKRSPLPWCSFAWTRWTIALETTGRTRILNLLFDALPVLDRQSRFEASQ